MIFNLSNNITINELEIYFINIYIIKYKKTNFI